MDLRSGALLLVNVAAITILHRPKVQLVMKRFYILLRLSIFIAIFAGLQLSWIALRGTAVEYTVIHDATVRPAAFLVNTLTPNAAAQAVKFTLHAPGGGLNILNGCEGLEALFLLCAAFAVAPLTWRSRVLGLLLGIAVVFAVNQARILLLFYAYRTDHALFDPLHSTVTPIAVVLLVAAYFYAWLFMASRHADAT
jgi:exosortase/archaeosortase family protein